MYLDAIDLKDFYASPLGAVVRRLLGARVRARWSNLQGKSLFGLGFATPYLGAFRNDASSPASRSAAMASSWAVGSSESTNWRTAASGWAPMNPW